MTEWQHQCNEHELGQTLGDSEGRGSLAYSPWGRKELDTTGRLNNNKNIWNIWLLNSNLREEDLQAKTLRYENVLRVS